MSPSIEDHKSELSPDQTKELLLQDATEFERQGKYFLAIVRLDEAIKYETIPVNERWWYYFTKTRWLWSLGRQDEAIQLVDQGIQIIGSPPILLYLKADCVLRKDRDYQLAIQLLDLALEIYETNTSEYETIGMDLPSELKNLVANLRGVFQFTNAIFSLRAEALTIKAEVTVENQVKAIESKLDKEKANVVEILSIFTAVMALIIIGGSMALKFTLRDAMLLIISLAILLICFMSFTSFVFDDQVRKAKFFPKLFDFRLIVIFVSSLLAYVYLSR